MDTLDRYLVREFLSYFAAVLLCLGALFIAIDFLSKFWHINMPIARILSLYLYKFPGALNQFVPVASLMATLFVLAAMSKQNEILALYSGGISNVRIISTFIALVAAISTITFLIFDPLVPAFQKKQILVEKGMDPSSDALVNFSISGFWYRSGSILYNVGHFSPETNTIENLNLFVLGPEHSLIERTHANKAVYNGEDWVLESGFTIKYPPDTHFPLSETFESKSGVIPEKPSDYKSLKIEETTMRLKELRRYVDRNRGYGLDTTSQQVHYHERVSLIFAPLIFVLLALAFSLHPLKTHSMAKSVSFCFLIVFLYLLTQRMSLSIGRGGHIPPLFAGWTPNFIFLSIALFLIFKR